MKIQIELDKDDLFQIISDIKPDLNFTTVDNISIEVLEKIVNSLKYKEREFKAFINNTIKDLLVDEFKVNPDIITTNIVGDLIIHKTIDDSSYYLF